METTKLIQTEAVERVHQMIPQTVNLEFDNTNVTLSMHSQKRWVSRLPSAACTYYSVHFDFPSYGTFSHLHRHLNWTLKSLKVSYGRDDEQLPLKSFTPELSFPQSSLELVLEG